MPSRFEDLVVGRLAGDLDVPGLGVFGAGIITVSTPSR